MVKRVLGDYSDIELSRMKPSYAGRIRARRAKYGPDALIVEARGHKSVQTPLAVRRRLPPEQRYTPEYLETLSPKYRRDILKEQDRVRNTGLEFDISKVGSYPKKTARDLYISWIKSTTQVQGTRYMSFKAAYAAIWDERAPRLDETYGEVFEKTWFDAKQAGTTSYLISLYREQLRRADGYWKQGRAFGSQPDINTVVPSTRGLGPAQITPTPREDGGYGGWESLLGDAFVSEGDEGEGEEEDEEDLSDEEIARDFEPVEELDFGNLYNSVEQDFYDSLPDFFFWYR